MCERARRSRDSSTRYSIDTLFPGLSNSIPGGKVRTTDDVGSETGMGGSLLLGTSGGTIHSSSSSSSQSSSSGKISSLPAANASQKVKKPSSKKGGSRPGSSTRDSAVNLPRDGNNDNGTNLSTLRTPIRTSSGPKGKSGKTCRSSPKSKSGTGPKNRPQQQQQQQPRQTSSVKTSGGGRKRRASSPLKATSQAKQITPLSGSTTTTTTTRTRMSRIAMQEVFQPWVLQTYGDSAKTKTITRKKYARIIKTLRGEEVNNAENSKFRFWVKAKGFHVGLPPGQVPPPPPTTDDEESPTRSNEPHLVVPTTVKDEGGVERVIYKRVAVVEQFFDIIYTVHVETEAKNGKHAGQKRTYRAITEKYAFLPREAVTKFLLQCTECQKRGSPNGDSLPVLKRKLQQEVDSLSLPDNSNGGGSGGSCTSGGGWKESEPHHHHPLLRHPPSPVLFSEMAHHHHQNGNGRMKGPYSSPPPPPFDINFSLPFTTTYLRKQKKGGGGREENGRSKEDFLHDEEDDESRMTDPTSLDEDHEHVVEAMPKKKSKTADSRNSNHHGGGGGIEAGTDLIPNAADWLGYHPIALKKERLTPTSTTTTCSNNNSIYSNGKNDFKEQSSPLSLSDRSAVNHETGQDETSSNGNKEDEDDDDDESEDKIDTHSHDPERLKAFNMFVRLFVDENLDRMVPISKQPKEKIQAIIDSCTRQFPEFAERARKRIRTYLKSCRRNKRARDSSWESSRPTPAHLTSVQAEQILAQACENESQNAKRMRMGLEPVGQPLPVASIMQNGTARPSSDSGTLLTNGGSKDKEEKEHGGGSHTTATTTTSSSGSTPDKVSMKSTPSFPSNTGNNGVAPTTTTPTTAVGGAGAMSSIFTTPPGIEPGQVNGGPTSVSSAGVRTPLSSSGSENQISGGGGKAPTVDRSHLLDYGSSRIVNGNALTGMSMYRPNFCQAFTRPFPGIFPPVTPPTNVNGGGSLGLTGFAGGLENCLPNGGAHNNNNNNSRSSSFPSHHNVSSVPVVANGNEIGPTDLSMKSKPPSLASHKLNSTEMSTVRQLITGYRESAAFLLRSADELEQLIIQQQ